MRDHFARPHTLAPPGLAVLCAVCLPALLLAPPLQAQADTTPPAVQSITLNGSPATDTTVVDFTVTFDEKAYHLTEFQVLGVSGTASGTVRSISTAAVTGTSVVGGLVGRNGAGLEIRYSTGVVSGTGPDVGKLVGADDGDPVTNAFWDTEK